MNIAQLDSRHSLLVTYAQVNLTGVSSPIKLYAFGLYLQVAVDFCRLAHSA